MIARLLPPAVAVEEAFDDALAGARLFPEEEEAVAQAVAKRRTEFTVARACARRALQRLGHAAVPIPRGERGAPVFPPGLVGSLTHCDGYRAAALARTGDLASVGVDAEPHLPLPEGVLEAVSLPQERRRLAARSAAVPSVHWDRLLFCAKEAVYKTWFPLTRRWLDFSEADITPLADDGAPPAPGGAATAGPSQPVTTGTFTARLLVPGPVVAGRTVEVFHGRWAVSRGLVGAAIGMPVDGADWW
ncbi:4'-phosphopantetheinyl transferase [Streptomyces sp. NPDC059740]|uniref:4'-phosphopantetheinyl transferase family protein n=1 Tax=Streptomyces sp. NPDC059740 TaxID=3346926 RepID=UPI00364D859E